jgi:hypothetical protein
MRDPRRVDSPTVQAAEGVGDDASANEVWPAVSVAAAPDGVGVAGFEDFGRSMKPAAAATTRTTTVTIPTTARGLPRLEDRSRTAAFNGWRAGTSPA